MVLNCSFLTNTASEYGGGLYVISYGDHSSVQLTSCSFIGNTASEGGGGLDVFSYGDHSSVQLTSCSFIGNSAVRGGGINTFVCLPSGLLLMTKHRYRRGGMHLAGTLRPPGRRVFNHVPPKPREHRDENSRSQLDFEDCCSTSHLGNRRRRAIWLRAADFGRDLHLAGTDFTGNTAATGNRGVRPTGGCSGSSPPWWRTARSPNSADFDGGARKSYGHQGIFHHRHRRDLQRNAAGDDGARFLQLINGRLKSPSLRAPTK